MWHNNAVSDKFQFIPGMMMVKKRIELPGTGEAVLEGGWYREVAEEEGKLAQNHIHLISKYSFRAWSRRQFKIHHCFGVLCGFFCTKIDVGGHSRSIWSRGQEKKILNELSSGRQIYCTFNRDIFFWFRSHCWTDSLKEISLLCSNLFVEEFIHGSWKSLWPLCM